MTALLWVGLDGALVLGWFVWLFVFWCLFVAFICLPSCVVIVCFSVDVIAEARYFWFSGYLSLVLLVLYLMVPVVFFVCFNCLGRPLRFAWLWFTWLAWVYITVITSGCLDCTLLDCALFNYTLGACIWYFEFGAALFWWTCMFNFVLVAWVVVGLVSLFVGFNVIPWLFGLLYLLFACCWVFIWFYFWVIRFWLHGWITGFWALILTLWVWVLGYWIAISLSLFVIDFVCGLICEGLGFWLVILFSGSAYLVVFLLFLDCLVVNL